MGVKKCEENFALKGEPAVVFAYFAAKGELPGSNVPHFW